MGNDTQLLAVQAGGVARFLPAPQGYNPASQAVLLPSLTLDGGGLLDDVIMTFETWGELNADKSNVILVEHALTGDSHVVGEAGPGQPTAGWWPGLIGPGATLDTDEFFVVAINVLGGCRGSSGPASAHPDGGVWGSRFPQVTIRDQVRAEAAVIAALGIDRLHAVIGGSMGGMRAAEWIASYPSAVERALIVASTAKATADQIACGHLQLQAIFADPEFHGGDYARFGTTPQIGLGLARQIAHCSYRSATELEMRFGTSPQGEEEPLEGGRYAVQSYLDYHGKKLTARFDAMAYVRLTQAMATHDIGRDRGGVEAVLRRYPGKLIVAAVDSDRLFPVSASVAMVRGYGRGRLRMIHSPYGHDGFLIEADQIASLVAETVSASDTRRIVGVA